VSLDTSQNARSANGGVAEAQRARILAAVVEVVAEHGVAGASVGLVCARARVSSRTFYTCFDGLEECLVAVLDGALARAAPLVAGAFARKGPWQEGMRRALAEMLAFFDEDPALAQVCLVELGTAAPVVREHRERILQAFSALVVAQIGEFSHPSPLAAEGAYASVVGIVNARLTGSGRAGGKRRALLELLGPLMGIVVAPFMDEAEVAREVQRGEELACEMLAERARHAAATASDSEAPAAESAAAAVPAQLRNPGAHRARQCLLYVAAQNERGHEPSNSEVAAGIGVSHPGQASALLARLRRTGLLAKRTGRPGHPNAWRLTAAGELAARALRSEKDRI